MPIIYKEVKVQIEISVEAAIWLRNTFSYGMNEIMCEPTEHKQPRNEILEALPTAKELKNIIGSIR